jgi:general secretion pathway protein F
MISAGEAGGCLESVLNELADFLESRDEMDSAVKSAAIYPAIMLMVGTFVLTFIFVFVVPKLVKIFEDSDNVLPLATVILITLSNFLKHYLWALVIGIVCLTYVVRRYIQRHALVVGRILTKMPVLNSLYISRFLKTTGSLLKNGVPMLKTLRLASKTVGNAFYEKEILDAERSVSEGLSLSSSLPDFPPIVREIILTGERSGSLAEMLLRAALTYEKEFKSGTKRLLSALEPLIVLVMGVIVGFIVFAVLLPVFELNQLIK